ncbi:MAG TPA: hypothetical protein VFF69_16350 [Phycisphaerales bacterium]|nr:hypothetical protein [Phycisphaerales bacterium]
MAPYPNLLPKSLLAERARRRRIRQWLAVAVLESALLTVACLALRIESFDAVSGMDSTIRSTADQIDLMSTAVAASRGELADLERRMAITSEVDRQPDWSIVLAMVARKGADVVRLESCQLLPGIVKPGGEIEYRFTVLARCPTQSDLTRFVQELEATGVFSRTKVVETRTVSEPGEPAAVRFTLESSFVEGGA